MWAIFRWIAEEIFVSALIGAISSGGSSNTPSPQTEIVQQYETPTDLNQEEKAKFYASKFTELPDDIQTQEFEGVFYGTLDDKFITFTVRKTEIDNNKVYFKYSILDEVGNIKENVGIYYPNKKAIDLRLSDYKPFPIFKVKCTLNQKTYLVMGTKDGHNLQLLSEE